MGAADALARRAGLLRAQAADAGGPPWLAEKVREVALGLEHAARGAAEVDPAFELVELRRQARLRQRLARRAEREAVGDRAALHTRGSRGRARFRSELGAEARMLEACEGADRRSAGGEARPESLDAITVAAHRAEAGDRDRDAGSAAGDRAVRAHGVAASRRASGAGLGTLWARRSASQRASVRTE